MVIRKEFQIPKIRKKAIIRQRLEQQLTQNIRSGLILVSAPAGYGKSVLISQSLAHYSHLSWYNIEDYDDDPEQFFYCFILALKSAAKQPFPMTEALLKNTRYTVKKLFNAFRDDYSSITQPCCIVLDNYHKISHKRIHDFIRLLLSCLPDNLNISICILSRQIPPFNLAQLRLQSKLIHINKLQLVFSEEEITTFIKIHYPELTITSDRVRQLYQYCKGWISPIILVLDTVKDDYALLNLINKGSAHLNFPSIDQYIEDEILTSLSSSTLRLCMRLSLFPFFTERQATIITQGNGTTTSLEELFNLSLLSVIDNEKNQFSFHPLIREYLNIRRLKCASKQESELTETAIQAYLEEGYIEEALSLITDSTQIIPVLKKHGWSLFNQFKLPVLEKSLRLLSEQDLYLNPDIGILSAWIKLTRNDPDNVSRILATYDSLLPDVKDKTVKYELSGQFEILKAQLAIYHHDPKLALEHAEQALICLDHASYRGRCIATSIIGEVNHTNGKLEQALSLMQQTERFARQHKLAPQIITAQIQQGEIYLAQGMLSLCDEELSKANKIITQYRLFHFPFYSSFIAIQIEFYLEKRMFTEAQKCGEDAMSKIDDSSIPDRDRIVASLAKVEMSQKKWKNAADALAHLTIMDELSSLSECSPQIAEAKLYYWLHSQNNMAVKLWLDQTHEPQSGFNHHTQCQYRNIALACLIQKNYDRSECLLNQSIADAEKSHLLVDLYRSHILLANVYHMQNRKKLAKESLLQSLSLSAEYKICGYYYLTGKWVLTYLNEIINVNKSTLTRTEIWHTYKLRDHLNTYYFAAEETSQHSEHNLVFQISHYQREQGSPLTPREAQIFSLIYTGWKNDQIADYCKVAPTTVKSHIRNLYQKLSVSNRQQAKALADQLMNQ
ncbi:HTH-type transcriptional regulator MalT [Vibrio salinus]|uniref:HTH-type transcriptional regulator MalT n=1 Tax=Vibrio salinus TaxID=2899784 RepID=UPI001E2B68A3|nr:HTH-type transcriptional regulator MalT [Vibrio salinus]MCE0495142.1 HTH-type transcriptional regulator MalT [Vibrio salinus]